MKNVMKKVVVGLLLCAAMLTCAACGTKRGVCEECGQTETLHRYVMQGGFGNAGDTGNVAWLCDDCYRMAKFFGY